MRVERQSEWKTMPLEDWMVAIIDYRGKTPRKTTSGIPLVTAKIVKNGRIETPEEFMAEADYDGWMRRGIPEPGDVVLTTEAPLGEVAQLDDTKIALAQRIITLRGKPDLLDNTYLRFALQSAPIQEQLRGRASGSTVSGIKQSELRKLALRFPPVDEQRRVAEVLVTLDDKIDLNRRINQTLEAMAQAIFKSWFVDFDPVKAKIAAIEQGEDPLRAAISGKTDAELDQMPHEHHDQLAAAAELFPDAMEESELGRIPKGWRVVPASALIEFNPKEPLCKGTVAPYLDMASLPTSGSWAESPVPREFGSGMRFRNGDALLARITPCLENGKSAFIQNLPDESVGWGSTEFIVMRSKKPVPQEYAYLLVRHAAFREHAIRSMAGTSGRQRAQTDTVAGFKVVVPSDDSVWRAFAQFVSPLFKGIKSQSETIGTLAGLRDVLLPKLLAGELLKEPPSRKSCHE